MKNALITGITGQDGAYLAHFLLGKGYRVWGTVRAWNRAPIPALHALNVDDRVTLLPVDFSNTTSLACAIEASSPDEIYNLAAQSSVAASFNEPTATGEITGLGVARLLEAMRLVRTEARFFQATSSEMFGQVRETPQTENTPFHPRSPYGAAKVYAHSMTINYREAYGCHASSGILYNHESPLRPAHFVTRKVTMAAARIKHGLQNELSLGNLDVERDWGFAGDYVEAMWLMLQQETPDDYVIATGQKHSLRRFVECAFRCVDLDYRDYVHIDPAFFRPAEAHAAVGCCDKAHEKLGWRARMSFEQLIEFMVAADINRVLDNDARIRYLP